MTRVFIVIASVALGVAAPGGAVSAQETTTVADGGYSVADPSNPVVSDEGDVQIYGEIATGGTGGEVLGDPAGLASIRDHDAIVNSVPPPVLVPEDDPAPPPAPAPADDTTTTTAETTTDSSETTADGTAPSGAAPVETAALVS